MYYVPFVPFFQEIRVQIRTKVPTIVGLFALACTLFFLSPPAQAESRLDTIQSSGKLRVGTTGDFNPMSFRNPKTGEYEGYDIEVVKALAKDMGVELVFVATDWKNLVSGVVSDKYDLTTSASLTPKRALTAGYSDPYVLFGTVPVMQKGDSFSSWDSINRPGVKVAVTLGTVFHERAKQFFPKASLVVVEPPARDYQEVLSNRADVSLTSNIEAATLQENYAELIQVPVEEVRSATPGAFLLPRDEQVWINYVNHWIALQKARGFFQEQNLLWFKRK